MKERTRKGTKINSEENKVERESKDENKKEAMKSYKNVNEKEMQGKINRFQKEKEKKKRECSQRR